MSHTFKVKTPSQTITVELTEKQTEAIVDVYFDAALRICLEQKVKTLYLVVYDPDHDRRELKINLDKEMRHLASGNWLATDYEELAAMVKSFGRTYAFLQRYLKTWETDADEDDEVPNKR